MKPAVDHTVLQSILLPGLDFSAPEDMYVRFQNEKVRAALKERTLLFSDGGRASFDTFFNGVAVNIWRRVCEVDDLHVILKGAGTFVLRVGLHRIGNGHRWLDERVIKLGKDEDGETRLDRWPGLDAGMLYFSLEAVGKATLVGGYFATATRPRNEVNLGIVITHFDRKPYVLPALKRLRVGLLSDSRYNIELAVVDNSRNITAAEATGITLLPNMNFGGSGGFMKGLLYFKNRRAATHCLFMDDDASCETDSIKRAYAMLQFATTDKFAVAASLLREIEPYRLFEKGSNFTGVCHPQKGGLDMRSVGDLLFAEQIERRPDYGGWWFFAFAIADIQHFSFPFFIRGDDIQFAMTNKLEVCTVNGVASWAEDFGLKSGPLPIYFDVRSHLAQRLCVLSSNLPAAIRMIFRFFFLSLFSYNYATAQAVTIAVRDVLGGPQFWIDNLDMGRKRAAINGLSPSERPLRIDRSLHNPQHRAPAETRLRRLVRRLTLNGFLLPPFLLKDAVVFQHKDFCASLSSIFRYKKILYEYEPLGLGYIAEHDKARFFRELFSFLGTLVEFVVRFSAIKRDYNAAFPEMTSEAFWQKVYARDASVIAATPAQTAAETSALMDLQSLIES